jgi:hypothetical protein
MILRSLNWQGIAGIAVAFTLMVMLTVQKLEAVRWKRQSEKAEQLYQQEQAAFATTTANYRAAAAQARANDAANAERMRAVQAAINQETQDAFQIRLADARTRAERLRFDAKDPADPRSGRAAPVPGLPASAGSAAQGAGEDRLPAAQLNYSDALIATEQAIQLDELIQWVRKQHAVEPSAEPSTQP